MLQSMGRFRLDAANDLLDDKWQYGQMGMSSNRQRRIPVIYILATAGALPQDEQRAGGGRLLQVSTDFVFDGRQARPWPTLRPRPSTP